MRLVEDNAMNAAFFTAVLEPEGHTVTLAITGPAGRTLALEEPFDLIALDIELPGLRGDALCQQLRAGGVRTPMVALTASAMPDQLAAIAVAGFDECMTKPIDPGDLPCDGASIRSSAGSARNDWSVPASRRVAAAAVIARHSAPPGGS